MKKDYIPIKDVQLDEWEALFLDNIDAVATGDLGIPTGDVAAVKNLITAHRNNFKNANALKIAAKAANKEKSLSRQKAVRAARKLAQRMKNTPGYNEGLGNRLQIVGPEHEFDKLAAKPKIRLDFSGDHVRIRFNKPRGISGVHIFVAAATKKTFTRISVDTQSPYFDSRPNLTAGQPEMRSYKVFFFKNDSIIGLESNENNILVNL